MLESSKTVLRLQNISKRFGSLLANDRISLDLDRGEVLALLGENGAGKTTLMSILFGHYLADAGSIEVFGQPLKMNSPRAALNAGIGMVHQHFTLADNLSVLDNITLGTEPLWRVWRQRDSKQRVIELSDRFGLTVNPDVRIADLSVGERQRVEILKVLYRDVKILILDEPTAVLTPQEVEGLFATLHKLTAAGLSVIFISHKLQEVMAVSDRVVVLRSGQVVADLPTAQTYPAQLAEYMVGRSIAPPARPQIPPGDPLLELQGVTVGMSGRFLLEAIDLTICQHEIVGIAGVSGNGQATLFNLICGLVRPTSGTVRLDGRPLPTTPAAIAQSGVARIPEDRQTTGLVPDMSIWENLILESHQTPKFSRGGWLKLKAAQRHAIDLIKSYDVRCPSPDATVRLLSGGNMQKLILGRELSNQPRLVLASQPTRGLDFGAVQYVHQQLLDARSNGAGVLLISEDLEELLSLGDRLFVIYQGRLAEVRDRSPQAIGLMMSGKSS